MRFFMAIFLMFGSESVLAKPEYAWWVTVEFEPTGTEVSGVSVEDIDSQWIRARPLTLDDVPEDAGSDLVRWNMEQNDLHFSIADDFDQDGEVETAIVGIFEAKSGARGNFLLITGPSGDVELSWNAGTEKAGFSVIRKSETGLIFAYCLACGNLVDINATGKDSYEIRSP